MDGDATNPPGAAIKLTEAMLFGAAWHFGHAGRPPGTTEFRLLPGGGIGGYDHVNERSWRLDDGTLSLFTGYGELTVRFDEADVQDGRLILLGTYRLAPALNLMLTLHRDYRPPAAAPPSAVLGYGFVDGGLNNQKMALLGLFQAALEQSRAVALPRMCILDHVGQSRNTVPLDTVFDIGKLADFADGQGIPLVEADASVAEQPGWPYHGKGAGCLSSYFRDRAHDAAYRFPVDFLRALVPLARSSYLLEKLAGDVFGQFGVSVVAQFRIERDWTDYAERELRPRYGGREDYSPHFERIVQKIRNTLPDARGVYVACDEAALPVATSFVRETCRAKFGVELLWKSDLLTAFERALLTPLQLSLLDFEMALRAPKFVGITRSTFSNMVTFEKYCLTGRAVTEHYIYNTDGDGLALRTDSGVYDDPRRATGVAVS